MSEMDPLALLRATVLERERLELGYATPSNHAFMRNPLVDRLGTIDDDGSTGPRFTFYAQPADPIALSIERVTHWLDAESRRYDPLPSARFIPRERTPTRDGIVAYRGDDDRLERFLVVRRTGTVEYAPWWGSSHDDSFIANVKLITGQFEQVLRFAADIGTAFGMPATWTVMCNARSLGGVQLSGFGEGWQGPYISQRPKNHSREERFQFEIPFAADAADSHAAAVRELAERIDLCFGSTSARAYDRSGERAGAIVYDGVHYE